ncbi:MAG: flavodoxin family protein [Syntrophorhabdaceae bacterium]|nr:flavodoxin family protein [Syntrophorhabdaceae bacterium]
MKITVFNGSPRIRGNTDILIEAALKAIKEKGYPVEVFRLNTMNIKPCQDCGGCDNTGICIIEDDMDLIYRSIREADRVILASPIFFSGLSAQAKIMIDRCQALWCEKYLLKRQMPQARFERKGLLLLVGGMKKDTGIKCGEESGKAFFRSIGIPIHETMGFTGIDKKGAILEHPTALRDVYDAARRLTNYE